VLAALVATGLLAACGPVNDIPPPKAPKTPGASVTAVSPPPTTTGPEPDAPDTPPTSTRSAPTTPTQPDLPPIIDRDDFPTKIDAGEIPEDFSPITVQGEGPAEVRWELPRDASTIATLDCSACTGDVILTGDGRMTPFFAGPAPLTGTAQVTVFPDDEDAVIVDAQGPWTLELLDWNFLPRLSGPQLGAGPAVLYFGDPGVGLEIVVSENTADDAVFLRFIGEEGTAEDELLQGWTGPGATTMDVELPGILTIRTNGSWTITPL
jgi:hypothetical protein